MMRQWFRSEIDPWTIIIAIIIFMILMAVPSWGQTTTVTATVIDQAGTVWKNGTYKLDFVPNPNYPSNNVYWNGSPFPTSQWTYAGNLDGTGAFSASSIPSNNFITPTGSTYTLTVCPNATSPCSVIKTLTIQGTSINFSSTITAQTPAPKVAPLPLARAYNDAEVQVNPTLVGYFYQNVTTNTPRYWDGSFWQNFGSGLASFTAGNLTPLFTTSVGADPINPNLTFTATNVAALTVYANCTGISAKPSFCAINAQMLPVTITSNTSGSAGSLSGSLTQCGANNFAKGITSIGAANCAQPTFGNLANNISTLQMNSGTNADSSHVFIGGNSNNGSWVTFSTITSAVPVTKIQKITGGTICTVGSSNSFDDCTFNTNWASAFADNNYVASVNCVPAVVSVAPASNDAGWCRIVGQNASGVTVEIQNGRSFPYSVVEVDIIGVHQ